MTIEQIVNTGHICHCNICETSRALTAVRELEWPDEHREKLEEFDRRFENLLEYWANYEMDAVWTLERIAKAAGAFPVCEDIIRKVEALKAQVEAQLQ